VHHHKIKIFIFIGGPFSDTNEPCWIFFEIRIFNQIWMNFENIDTQIRLILFKDSPLFKKNRSSRVCHWGLYECSYEALTSNPFQWKLHGYALSVWRHGTTQVCSIICFWFVFLTSRNLHRLRSNSRLLVLSIYFHSYQRSQRSYKSQRSQRSQRSHRSQGSHWSQKSF
jgi:hypothetical protein